MNKEQIIQLLSDLYMVWIVRMNEKYRSYLRRDEDKYHMFTGMEMQVDAIVHMINERFELLSKKELCKWKNEIVKKLSETDKELIYGAFANYPPVIAWDSKDE